MSCYFLFVLSLFGSLQASLLRYTLAREESTSPIIYYLSKSLVEEYPILVISEGSSTPGQLESVLRLQNYFAQKIEPFNIGYLAVEK